MSLGLSLGLGLGPRGKRAAIPSPYLLFGSGEDGFLFDFSKTDQLFQTSDGQTAVALDGDPAGLALDAHGWAGKTLAAEAASLPEQVVNGTFSVGTGWTLTNATISGGKLNCASATAFENFATQNLTIAGPRLVSFDVSNYVSGTLIAAFVTGAVVTAPGVTANGSYSYVVSAAASSFTLLIEAGGAGFTGSGDNVSVKSIPGNYGSQSSTPARPFWKTGGFLRPDASDDNLLTTFLSGASGNSAVAKVKVPASISATQVVMGTSGSATARFFIGFNTSGQMVGGVGTDSTTTVISAVDYRGLSGTMALTENGTNWFLYWNGAQVATGLRNGAPSTTIPWRLFALNNNGTASSFAAVDTYKMLAINRALTVAELLNLNTW